MSKTMDTYLGHTATYWLELEKRADKLGEVDLIQEITDLRGKISFYESRIKQMNEMMSK